MIRYYGGLVYSFYTKINIFIDGALDVRNYENPYMHVIFLLWMAVIYVSFKKQGNITSVRFFYEWNEKFLSLNVSVELTM